MTTEIREPLGRGIDHPREAVAILGVSFRVRMWLDALKAYSANAESLQANDVDAAEMSGVEKTLHNQSTGAQHSGQGYCRPAVLTMMRAGADKIALETESSARMCYRFSRAAAELYCPRFHLIVTKEGLEREWLSGRYL